MQLLRYHLVPEGAQHPSLIYHCCTTITTWLVELKSGRQQQQQPLRETYVHSSDISQGLSFLLRICGARYCDNKSK